MVEDTIELTDDEKQLIRDAFADLVKETLKTDKNKHHRNEGSVAFEGRAPLWIGPLQRGTFIRQATDYELCLKTLHRRY
jgi:hypothetical protein